MAEAASATTTWTGLGDGTSWGNANNWDNGVPDATKDAVITLASSVSATTTAGTISFDSLLIGGSSASNTLTLTGSVSGNSITIDNNGTLVQNNSTTQLLTGALTVKSGGLLTHTTNTTALSFTVNVAADTIDVQSGGSVNVDGKGYKGGVSGLYTGQGPGGGVGNNNSGAGGGAHGGNGANGTSNIGGISYCNPTSLITIGSGGGSDGAGDDGGDGGGLIRLSATSTVTINGSISAKGRSRLGSPVNGTFNGGGAGGGVRISAPSISGTPSLLSVVGGTGGSSSGGGGGGCVGITYTASNSLTTATMSVLGGSGLRTGGPGQIFIKQVGSNGDIYILGNGTANASTTQAAVSLSIDTITVSSTSGYGVPSGGSLTLLSVNPLLGDRAGIITVTGTLALSATNTIANMGVLVASGGTFTNQAVVNIAKGASLVGSSGSTFATQITEMNTSGTLSFYRGSVNIASTANLEIGFGTTTVFAYTTTTPLVLGDVTIKSGGYLTHGANTTTQAHILNVAANTIDVQSGGAITVDGMGYRGGISGSYSGQGPGAGIGTNSFGAGGGAYGGNGGKGVTNIGGTAYCDPSNAVALGSGGGNDNGTDGGGAGGGLIRLSATSTLTINGVISAKGYASGNAFTVKTFSGGGSGGGVNIIAAAIAGTPNAFSAIGGTGGSSGGGGGGGCVSITYTTSNSLSPTTTMSVVGGGGVQAGGTGLVYIKQTGGVADLYVIGNGTANAGSSQGTGSTSVNSITVSSTASYGIPSGGTLTLSSANPLLGDRTGTITATGTLVLTATSTISNMGVALASGGVFTGQPVINISNGATFTIGSGSTFTSPLTAINTSGTLNVYRSTSANISSAANLVIGSGTTTMYGFSTTTPLTLGDVTVKNGGYITHGANFDTQTQTLNIAANNIDVQSGGSITVTGRGYQGGQGGLSHYAGYGPGGGGGNNNLGAGGGAHGGNGGAGVTWAGGTAYCSSTNPVTIGSGGGSDASAENGGNGGGLIQLSVTSTLTINGAIAAKGRAKLDLDTAVNYNGGGAGGGVKISATTIAGTPTLFSAVGGTGGAVSGGGGGGCVSITYTTLTGTATSSVTVAGGSGGHASGLIGTTNFVSNTPANTAPTAVVPYPIQSSDALVTVTSTIADADLNTASLGVQYSTDNSTWANATIGTATENGEGNGVTTSTGLISDIDTNTDGSVDLTFAWNAGVDLPTTEDTTVYLRITPNDGTASGTTMTSAAFSLDTKDPTAPGALTVNTTSTQSVTFNLGAASTDQSFREYVIYYKTGSSGVSTADTAYTSSSDPHLGSISYGGFSTVTLPSVLSASTQYVANIWAFDAFGRNTPSASEVAFYTLADTPGTPTVTASSSATLLHLTIDPATNPSNVVYSICRTTNGTSCLGGSSYVQADGSLGASPIFQSYTAWGGASGIEITGLTPNTGYRFLVQAENGDGFSTGYSTANATATTTNVGVTLSTMTVAVTEGGATDSYTVVLTSKPAADVTVTLSSDSVVTTTPRTMTFTTGNWSTPQIVTVTAVDDLIAQGAHTGTITHTVASADPTYDGLAVSDVTATITDNDTAGVNLSSSSVATTEGGATDSYTIVLNSQPTSTVTVVVSPDADSLVSTSSIAFTSANWNSAVTVTVTANDDAIAQGTHASTISHSVSSLSTGYSGAAVSSVTNTITDNDTAGVSFGATTVATAEGGATDSYTIVLNSQPTSTVTVFVSPDSDSLTSTSSIAFTSSDWNIPVTITITAVNDAIAQGTHSSAIAHSVSSQSTGYNGIVLPSVTNTITDNDTSGVSLNTTTVATTEGGATDSYTIVLNSQPTSTVTVLVSPDSNSLTSTSSIAFTSANWNSAVTVTVTAVDDAIAQGAHVSTIMHSVSSLSTGYDGIAIPSVTNTITDNDTSGVSLNTMTVATVEGGATDSYTIVLNSQPTSTVTVLLSPDSDSTVSTSSIAFTETNWNSPVTVTVTAVDDLVAQGTRSSIITHSVTSQSTGYDGIVIPSVTNTIADNDTAGVNLSSSSVATTEGGATDLYTIVLTSQPTSTVTVLISPDADSLVSTSSIAFTSANWNANVTVTVTAVDDAIAQGTHVSTIAHSATSLSTGYSGAVISSVTNTITDNDTPGVTVGALSGDTTEAGGTATFTVVLNSQPTNPVTIPVSSDDMTEGAVSTSTLTFDAITWNIPQTVTVTGVNDTTVDGSITYHVVLGVASSADVNYNGINPNDVTVITTDNDVASDTGGGGASSATPVASQPAVNTGTLSLSLNHVEQLHDGTARIWINLNADPPTVRGYALSIDPTLANAFLSDYQPVASIVVPVTPSPVTIYGRYYSATGNPSTLLHLVVDLTATAATAPPMSSEPPVQTPSPALPPSDVIADPSNLATLLSALGRVEDARMENVVSAQVSADAKEFNMTLTADQAIAIRNFIVYGFSQATITFGQGERRAIVRDYMDTVGRSAIVWSDIERISSGRIPLVRNIERERQRVSTAQPVFVRIFGHNPNFKNATENLAWNTLLYRIRFPRDLAKETRGVTLFYAMFRHTPTTPFGWSVVRMLGYVKK